MRKSQKADLDDYYPILKCVYEGKNEGRREEGKNGFLLLGYSISDDPSKCCCSISVLQHVVNKVRPLRVYFFFPSHPPIAMLVDIRSHIFTRSHMKIGYTILPQRWGGEFSSTKLYEENGGECATCLQGWGLREDVRGVVFATSDSPRNDRHFGVTA